MSRQNHRSLGQAAGLVALVLLCVGVAGPAQDDGSTGMTQATYKVQSPGVVVATGKLGTGTWRRISGASDNVTKAPPVSNAPAPGATTGKPITIRR